MVEVAHVDDIRPNPIQHLDESGIDSRITIAVSTAGNVDDVETDAWFIRVELVAEPVVRGERILLAGEHMNFVIVRQRAAKRLRVDLGPGVVAHGIPVDDLQDLHPCPEVEVAAHSRRY
jgi:hypothetical protein